MEILTGKVGCGKTVALIKKAFADNATIVVFNTIAVQHFSDACKDVEKATGFEYTKLDIITFDSFIKNKDHTKVYYIDQIDLCLQEFTGYVKGFSCDAEDIVWLEHDYNTGVFSQNKLI